MKTCSRCKCKKEITEFGNDSHRADGKKCYCKLCVRLIRSEVCMKRNKNIKNVCGTCKKIKKSDEFGREAGGIGWECKSCTNTRIKQGLHRRAKNLNLSVYAYKMKFNKLYKFERMIQVMKKSKRWKVSVTAKYLQKLYEIQKGLCALTNHPMRIGVLDYTELDSVSVDRINGKEGYRKGNIRLVCHWANISRSTLNDETHLTWCKRLIENSRRSK